MISPAFLRIINRKDDNCFDFFPCEANNFDLEYDIVRYDILSISRFSLKVVYLSKFWVLLHIVGSGGCVWSVDVVFHCITTDRSPLRHPSGSVRDFLMFRLVVGPSPPPPGRGIGYRRSKVDAIAPAFIRPEGAGLAGPFTFALAGLTVKGLSKSM